MKSWPLEGEDVADFEGLIASVRQVHERPAIVEIRDHSQRRLVELHGAVGTPMLDQSPERALIPVGDHDFLSLYADFLAATRYAIDRGSFWGIGIQYDGIRVHIGEDKNAPLGTIAKD